MLRSDGDIPAESPSLLWPKDHDKEILERGMGVEKDSRSSAEREVRRAMGKAL